MIAILTVILTEKVMVLLSDQVVSFALVPLVRGPKENG